MTPLWGASIRIDFVVVVVRANWSCINNNTEAPPSLLVKHGPCEECTVLSAASSLYLTSSPTTMPLHLLLHELQLRSTSPGNWSNVTSHDPLGEKSEWLRAVVATVSALSMVGAVLIVLSYVCISSIRTRSREILVHLSLADFGVACANFVGVVVDFDRYIRTCEVDERSWCNDVHHLCTAQAFFAGFSTIASILWTLALSVYIYLLVVHEPRKLHTKAVYVCYVLCWGLPLLISLWLVLTGGHTHTHTHTNTAGGRGYGYFSCSVKTLMLRLSHLLGQGQLWGDNSTSAALFLCRIVQKLVE